jgi:predicted RecB family nuclease
MGRPDGEHQWVKTQDPKIKQRILDYNEDDCVAIRVLLDRMRQMEVVKWGALT